MNKKYLTVITAIIIFMLLSSIYGVCYKCAVNKSLNNKICPACGNKYEQYRTTVFKKHYICPYCGYDVNNNRGNNE